MAQSRLGYWEIRGLGEPIRLLLEYVGEDYVNERYAVGPAPEYSREDWLKVKQNLGLTFPNLPYYIDEKVKMTETNAILRYLARKHDLYGDDDEAKALCDMLLEVIMGVRNFFVGLMYAPVYDEQKRKNYVETMKKGIDWWENLLGDKKFFAGDKICAADFHLYEMFDQHRLFEASLFDDCPKILQYLERFRELPRIKAYLASDRFRERPINNPTAHWF